MQWNRSYPCKADPLATIRTGLSSWGAENSVKYCYLDARGHVARSGPEVGGEILLEMLDAALSDGIVTPKEVASILHKNL
jgi:hypothetical protein